MTTATLHLGPVPAEEPCAQLGRTKVFDRYALLEANVHRAALIARFGPPPLGASLRAEGQRHDFGRYYDLVARYDAADPAARAWAAAIDRGLSRWLDAGFLAPVLYDGAAQVREEVYRDHFDAARRVIVTLERLRIDGYGADWEAAAIAHLRRAYPREAEDADQLLRQLATERAVRPPYARRVALYAPYALTFFPALFNDHRGAGRMQGDVIDVEARERRGDCRYVMVDLGSVRTLDEALEACWEHYARYVVR